MTVICDRRFAAALLAGVGLLAAPAASARPAERIVAHCSGSQSYDGQFYAPWSGDGYGETEQEAFSNALMGRWDLSFVNCDYEQAGADEG